MVQYSGQELRISTHILEYDENRDQLPRKVANNGVHYEYYIGTGKNHTLISTGEIIKDSKIISTRDYSFSGNVDYDTMLLTITIREGYKKPIIGTFQRNLEDLPNFRKLN